VAAAPDRRIYEWAQGQEKAGQHDAAAQAYARAGAAEDSARLYLVIGKPLDAGRVLLASIGYDRAKRTTLDAAQRKIALKAAICFGKGGDILQAVELYQLIGEKQRAVELLRSVNDHTNAARVEGDLSGRVELLGYGKGGDRVKTSEQASVNLQAAQALERAGKREAAFDAYVALKQYEAAARMASALGRTAEAASYYLQAGKHYEAGVCFRHVGDQAQALKALVQVSRDHPHYREACVQAIAAAVTLDGVDFHLDHLVAPFVASGPMDDRETEVFYQLALLYQRGQMADAARDCLGKVLKRRPGYRDAASRLQALEAESRASRDDIERVFAEEQKFRAKVAEHERKPTPPPVAADEMEELPELPDLPELAPVPTNAGQKPRPTPVRMPARPTPPVQAAPGAAPNPFAARPPTGAVAVPIIDPTSATAGILEGTVVNGRYMLERKIGQGGMGAVFRAKDSELDEVVAIKFLSAAAADEAMIQRFKQEVSLSRQFNHPNIIRLYDLGTYGEHKYITMELLNGRDLSKVMVPGQPMDLDRGLGYLVQACQALQAVHDRGVIHRDIKPENFFVTDDGVVKVMDFGIAKRNNAAKGLTRAGMMAGTPQYMAPEQINDFGSVNHLADIYSMGCIAYQMFTGAVPFDAEELMPILVAHMTQPPDPPQRKNPKIPPHLDALILKLLAKKPADRMQSCREIAGEVAKLRMELSTPR
jgi:serine/threonine-protein kinase